MITPQPPERHLGHYRIIERIGRGGMGVVYRAQHLRLGREAAIKVLPVSLADEADYLRRFEREAAAVASLDHPNILPVWDYGEHEGAPYLVMPYVKGGTLKDRLERGALPREELARYLAQLADALDFAHEQGIIHRDVKPANVLLDGRGRLYLADFGIAKALDGSGGLTGTGVGVGTPEYMAPEQAQGRADPRSDLYALGIILYQMLTGRVPYSGNSTVEVLMQHAQAPLPLAPLRDVIPPLPAGVAAVVSRALAKEPGARYQSGRALVAALEATLDGRPSPDESSGDTLPTVVARIERASAPPPVAAWRRGPLALAGLVGLLALLLVVGGGVAILARRGGDPTPTVGTGVINAARDEATPAMSPTGAVGASPTATIGVAVSAPSPTATTASPTATAPPASPTAAVPQPLGAVPAGWQIYRGRAGGLPFVIAYPPDWIVEETRVSVSFVSPDSIAGRRANLIIQTLGTRDPEANIDSARDGLWGSLGRSCERTGIERTRNSDFSGMRFATLFATCETGGRLLLFTVGAGLRDGVEWDFYAASAYAAFDEVAAKYFDPMLQSLNIYANPTP